MNLWHKTLRSQLVLPYMTRFHESVKTVTKNDLWQRDFVCVKRFWELLILSPKTRAYSTEGVYCLLLYYKLMLCIIKGSYFLLYFFEFGPHASNIISEDIKEKNKNRRSSKKEVEGIRSKREKYIIYVNNFWFQKKYYLF